jgi:hypothetical protein
LHQRFVVGGYVRKRVTLRISKGLRAISLAAGISQRVLCDTRVSSSPSSPSTPCSLRRLGHPLSKAQREDARNIITQARVNRSHYEWDEGNYEDKEKEMGALCFTRRVCRTQVPKHFRLPHDQQKYNGRQEPELWLSYYL